MVTGIRAQGSGLGLRARARKLDLNVTLTTEKNSEQPELELLNEPGNNKRAFKDLSKIRR